MRESRLAQRRAGRSLRLCNATSARSETRACGQRPARGACRRCAFVRAALFEQRRGSRSFRARALACKLQSVLLRGAAPLRRRAGSLQKRDAARASGRRAAAAPPCTQAPPRTEAPVRRQRARRLRTNEQAKESAARQPRRAVLFERRPREASPALC